MCYNVVITATQATFTSTRTPSSKCCSKFSESIPIAQNVFVTNPIYRSCLFPQGNEKLQAARASRVASERETQLEESLSLYKQITAQLDLPVVCNQFAQARFFRGRCLGDWLSYILERDLRNRCSNWSSYLHLLCLSILYYFRWGNSLNRFICRYLSMWILIAGIVDLALTAASKRDPQGLALHFYKNGQPQEDTQGAYFYAAR